VPNLKLKHRFLLNITINQSIQTNYYYLQHIYYVFYISRSPTIIGLYRWSPLFIYL